MSHHAEAAFRLGELYLRPDNPSADNAEAFRWVAESARAGFVAAQYTLALFYWAGRAVKRSPRQAYAWAMRAASKDSDAALLLLSKLMENGEAGPADAQTAYALTLRAMDVASNDATKEEAQLRLRELSLKLSVESIQSAEEVCKAHPDTTSLLQSLLES